MLYESINHRLIMGENINENERRQFIDEILSSIDISKIDLFTNAINYNNWSTTQVMYPMFFIPSNEDRSKKLRLITGERPKTKILSDNAFELEILRLLALWARGNDKVEEILYNTEKRLEKTCFAHFCSKGECIGASIAFLRFWIAYKPDDIQCQKRIVNGLKPYRDGKGLWRKGLDIPCYYTFSAFSECDYNIVEDELEYCASLLYDLLNKRWLDQPYHLICKHVVKNALSRIPRYKDVLNANFIIGNDGRLHTLYSN